jgi:hypothetical protein
VENRYGVHQVVTDPNLYTVWFYDYHDVFIVYLHRNGIPDTETALGRTQGDLDAEILDFETNYLPTANASLEKKAANKVAAVAAAKGLGGYLPNPSNNPYMPASDELVSLYVDGEGSLASRGTVLTDEGSFRNDFNADDLATPVTGLASFTSGSQHVYGSGSAFISEISKTGYIRPYTGDDYHWYKVARIVSDTDILIDETYASASVTDDVLIQAESIPILIGDTPGTLVLSGGKILADCGTTSGSGIGLYRQGDYGPMTLVGWLSINQRLDTQSSWFGFRDDATTPYVFADVLFTGSDDTKVVFRTGYLGESEESIVTLPSGTTTADQLKYTIEITPFHCDFLITSGSSLSTVTSSLVRHELHIPAPYDEMNLGGAIMNITSSVSSSILSVDCVLFLNYNTLTTRSEDY